MSSRAFLPPRRLVDVDVDADGTPTQSSNATDAPKARAATGASVVPSLSSLRLDRMHRVTAPVGAVQRFKWDRNHIGDPTKVDTLTPTQVSWIIDRMVQTLQDADLMEAEKLREFKVSDYPGKRWLEWAWDKTTIKWGQLPHDTVYGGDPPKQPHEPLNSGDEEMRKENAKFRILAALQQIGFDPKLLRGVGDGSFHLRFGIELGVPPVYRNSNVKRLFEALDAKQGRIELARRERERAAAQEQQLVRDIHKAADQRDKAAWDAYVAQKDELDKARSERSEAIKEEEAKRRRLANSQRSLNAGSTRSHKKASMKWQEQVARARDQFNEEEEEMEKFAGEQFKPRRFENTEEGRELLAKEPQLRSKAAMVSAGKSLSDSDSDDMFDNELPYGGHAAESYQGYLWRIADAEKRLQAARKAPSGSSEQSQREAEEAIAKIEQEIKEFRAALLAM